jgi:putative oxidoreductase
MTKNINHPGDYNGVINFALFILRVTAGAFMLTHGWGKLLMLTSGEPISFADPFGLGMTISLILAVIAEVLCAILIIAGFLTRLAAIPLIITMLTAAFVIHAQDPFNVKEMSLLYSLIFTVLAITGAGKISIDYLLTRKNSRLRRR